jgi:hypothetical protein
MPHELKFSLLMAALAGCSGSASPDWDRTEEALHIPRSFA